MWQQHIYVDEKLSELARQPLRSSRTVQVKPLRVVRPTLRPIARRTDSALHRLGHALESWGAPPASQHKPA